MRNSNYLLIILLAVLSFGTSAQTACDSTIRVLSSEKRFNDDLPHCKTNLQVVKHTAYTLGYSEPYEQAAWVCYVLSKTECTGDEERSSTFFEDKAVTTGSAVDADYKGTSYDRGHLAPAGDMTYNNTAMTESFFYSNMSPQVPKFNRGIWKKLETQVREWGTLYGNCVIITGPVFTDSMSTIGQNQVAVPHFYYKIILNPNLSPPQAIGFLLPNEGSSNPLTNYVVTIDSIETRTGIDFFPTVPAACQQQLESHVSGSHWKGFETVTITATGAGASGTKKKPKSTPSH